ncbi:MAG: thioredoxin family protein [Chthoniobacterales bacterium]|nr:thioredoxin family protein [Chthoniobacterales bacterium]
MPEAHPVKIFGLRFATIAAALLAIFASSARADVTWLTDFKRAQQEAKTGSKLLLVDFTGSDWCGWCIKLNREVFSKPEFKDYATKNLVLLEVDFPRQKKLNAGMQQQNEELAQHYQVEGFPTIVVLNGDGQKVGELGYMPGGPEAFIAELEKIRKG